MSVARNLVILGVWATGMGAFVWWKYLRIEDSLNVPGEASSTGVAHNSADAANTKDWKWQSESHWVVDQITRDITEMSLFALNANSDLDDPKVLEFSVTPTPGTHHGQTYVVTAEAPKGPLSVSLPLQKHLWAVENYLVWRDGLRRAWSPTAASKDRLPAGEQKELEELPQRLTTPTTESVVKESQKISQALTKNPQSPELHEAAALLIGTQALREAAGHFSDLRPSLSRITAHLVMARSAQPEPGTHGRLAEVILLTLEVRQQEALDKLESLPAGLEAWQRTLRMRNTGDWRVVQDRTDTTLLEKIEHARALTASLDTGAMVRKYEGELTGLLPDWSRLGTERNFSVEEGHRLTNHWMEKELGELASAWKAWSGKELNADSLVVVLNDPATRAVVKGDNKRRQIEVLSWGSLAASHQRHLCHAIGRTQLFLQDKWGVDDAAKGFENQVLQNFAGLRLLPFVQKRTARQPKTQAAAMEAASDLCRKHPEWVTSCNWFAVGQKSRSANAAANKAVSYPRAPAWFTVEVPWGTAYDFDSRYHDLGTLYRANQARWDELIAIAPYSYDVIRTHRHKTYGTSASLEQMQKSFAPVHEYHLRAMEETSDRLKDDPKAYLAAMTRVCQLDP
ncbi:MAG TPA: hypothetical protein VK956_12865, partial [Verrucomicrobium sp.]|nr:hypothetical protein [Verrucomicrobium sp.]